MKRKERTKKIETKNKNNKRNVDIQQQRCHYFLIMFDIQK